MSGNQDPARLIAERVARKLAGGGNTPRTPDASSRSRAAAEGEAPRARVINFVSSSPPARTQSSVGTTPEPAPSAAFAPSPPVVAQVTQSPWLAPFSSMQSGATAAAIRNQPVDHPSQERFGVEEAAVSELVEFFENEKQCTVDPSGQPCDHCAMCSSRGF